MAETIAQTVSADARTALKAGDRTRAQALRMVLDALQKDAKQGKDDEIAVLQRERKKRIEAAVAYRDGGRAEQAAGEEAEAVLIEDYLPTQLGDEDLARMVDEAVTETGATEAREMGQVMSILMPRVGGRADGKRVGAAVRKRLGA